MMYCIHPRSIFISSIFFASLWANEQTDFRSGEFGLEAKQNQLKSSLQTRTPPPFDADLFRRDVQCFSFRGEFLFWRIQEGAMDYALKMNSSGWGPTECYAQGEYQNTTFNGDPGFRFTFAFFRAPKYWEFWTQYTRLTATGSNAAGKPSSPTEYLTGTWPQIFTNPLASAKSKAHFNYNAADVLINRVFFTNLHLRLRFQGGGVVTWMDQFWKILYQDWSGLQTKLSNRWSFVGGGLQIGTMVDWYWFEDIYLTGGVNLASLIGSYHNVSKQTANFQPTSSFNSALPIRNAHFQDIRPTFQTKFFIGPAYQKNFPNQRFEFFVGYELVTWSNLSETFRSTSGTPTDPKETWTNSSLLALQGLTARAVIDF